MFSQNEKLAGLFFVVGGIVYLWANGAGVHYGSAMLTEIGLVLLGVLMLAGAYFTQVAFKSTLLTIFLVLAAVGSIGVAAAPMGGSVYYALAYLGYASFGISAILSYKYTKSPFNYLFLVLGVLSLIGLLLWVANVNFGSGMTASPTIVDFLALPWLVAFGANIAREKS